MPWYEQDPDTGEWYEVVYSHALSFLVWAVSWWELPQDLWEPLKLLAIPACIVFFMNQPVRWVATGWMICVGLYYGYKFIMWL